MENFPLDALPLGYHSPIPPNMKKFCDKNFCRNSTNKGRLHLEETQIESDINEEMDEDSCKLEKTDNYKSKKVETDSEKRILGNV
ncbi:unnamed protein product [Rhizophagus irregularis]|nr:unnamed protein product [Rhizophagus irregularis]